MKINTAILLLWFSSFLCIFVLGCSTESSQTSQIKENVSVTVEQEEAKSDDEALVTSFPGDPVSGSPVITESGLQWYDIVVGNGATPASSSCKVEVHYTGWLTNGTKFDSSIDRGETITFALNRVIAGWTEGVGSMKVGGKRKLIIPPHLGYGDRGAGSLIPGGATLVFDVELINTK